MLSPPIVPMLARSRTEIPPAGAVADAFFQQKVDGFRALAFLRSGRLLLQSRRGADLTAAFPDLASTAGSIDQDLVVDGELVVYYEGRLDFAALTRRARYTGRRAVDAARSMPAYLVLFDVLEAQGEVMLDQPYRSRWARLTGLFEAGVLRAPWTLISSTHDREEARAWLEPEWGQVGVEGVMVKSGADRYRPGERAVWKVRAFETTEAIVGGITGHARAPATLLLGRLDSEGRLRFIGRTTLLPAPQRREVGATLTPALKSGGHPWAGLRLSVGWGSREELVWTPVMPQLVVEVRADTAVEHGRYRHPMRLLRPRGDLAPGDVAVFGGETPRGR